MSISRSLAPPKRPVYWNVPVLLNPDWPSVMSVPAPMAEATPLLSMVSTLTVPFETTSAPVKAFAAFVSVRVLVSVWVTGPVCVAGIRPFTVMFWAPRNSRFEAEPVKLPFSVRSPVPLLKIDTFTAALERLNTRSVVAAGPV
jgi:hypothetical protein